MTATAKGRAIAAAWAHSGLGPRWSDASRKCFQPDGRSKPNLSVRSCRTALRASVCETVTQLSPSPHCDAVPVVAMGFGDGLKLEMRL